MQYRQSDVATITIEDRASEMYTRITGLALPKLSPYELLINPRTREHAQKLCDSIEAQRKHVRAYHP